MTKIRGAKPGALVIKLPKKLEPFYISEKNLNGT